MAASDRQRISKQFGEVGDPVRLPDKGPMMMAANGIHGHLLAVCGRENHLDVGPNPPYLRHDILAAHPRQAQVQQNHANGGLIGSQEVNGRNPVAGLEYGKTLRPEHLRCGYPKRLFVFYEEDGSKANVVFIGEIGGGDVLAGSGPPAFAPQQKLKEGGPAGRRGNLCSTAASPRPRPANLVVKNGSKILVWISWLMPHPVSLTSSRT